MRYRRGFTFIEITLVIVILGILAAIAAPKMASVFRRASLSTSVRDLMGMLRYARSAAVLSGSGCQVVISPEEGLFELSMVDIDPEGRPIKKNRTRTTTRRRTERPEFKVSDDIKGIHALESGVRFSLVHSGAPVTDDDRFPRVIFFPDGSADTALIAIDNERGQSFYIQVFRTTGLSRLTKGKLPETKGLNPLFVAPDFEFAPRESKSIDPTGEVRR